MDLQKDLAYSDRSGDFVLNLLLFARQLKDKGLPVTPGRSLGVIRGLSLTRLEEREEIYVLLSAHFVSRPEELPIFDSAFEAFWRMKPLPETAALSKNVRVNGKLPLVISSEGGSETDQTKDKSGIPAYSPQENLQKKDFGELPEQESEVVAEMIMALARNLGSRMGRRWRFSRKGKKVDLRSSLRASLRHGGDLMVLRKKRRRPKRTRFVVLCDVSASMDTYSRFLLQFIYGFQKHVPRVETFVFSTRLTNITKLLRMRKMTTAYQLIFENVQDWSGGTRIGSALAEYNKRYGRRYSGSNTVAILLSDGWDQGDLELLEREIKSIKQRVKRLIWLNPLLGMPDYRPIDRGMRTVLPYTDDFLDCHDLEQLEVFGSHLENLC